MSKVSFPSTASEHLARLSGQRGEELPWLGYATACVMFAVCSFASTAVFAQSTEPASQANLRVAVIDIRHIFKNLPAVQTQINKVKADTAKREAALERKKDTLRQAVEQLKTLKVGTAEFNRQEEYVVDLDSALRSWLRSAHRHRELSDAETKIYYDSYQRLTEAVKAIASQNDIQLVLRLDRKHLGKDPADSVANVLLRNVDYHDSTVDITDAVMRYLEQQTESSANAAGGIAERLDVTAGCSPVSAPR